MANGDPREKQRLRRALLPQFRELWKQSPLKDFQYSITRDEPVYRLLLTRDVGRFKFQPLIRSDYELTASLEITLLKPEEPGRIVTQSGDIDNLLKTLLDSLQMPKQNQIPESDAPTENETPFYCLLEDDNLITSLSVVTDRLLLPTTDRNEVMLLIHVITDFTHQHFTNIIAAPRLPRTTQT